MIQISKIMHELEIEGSLVPSYATSEPREQQEAGQDSQALISRIGSDTTPLSRVAEQSLMSCHPLSTPIAIDLAMFCF